MAKKKYIKDDKGVTMSVATSTLGLEKPLLNENYNIDVHNRNMDKIDEDLTPIDDSYIIELFQHDGDTSRPRDYYTKEESDLKYATKEEANNALNKANEAFQRGDNVKTQLVDKLISEGLNVSTNNTFEELIGSIALGKKWASGVSPVSTSTRLFYTMGGESSYYCYYFEIPLLGFNPNHVIFIGKTSTEISGYVSNLIQKYVTNGDIYINTYSKYSKDTSVTANTFCYEVAGEVLQTGIAMRIPCTSVSSLQNTEVSWIAFE